MDEYRLSRDTTTTNNIKKEVIQISEDYNIISKFTSFIAIESEIVNKTGHLLSTNIGSKHPKNWKKNRISKLDSPNYKNHAYMPQTATNNPLYLFLGLCLLITAFFIRRYNEKYI